MKPLAYVCNRFLRRVCPRQCSVPGIVASWQNAQYWELWHSITRGSLAYIAVRLWTKSCVFRKACLWQPPNRGAGLVIQSDPLVPKLCVKCLYLVSSQTRISALQQLPDLKLLVLIQQLSRTNYQVLELLEYWTPFWTSLIYRTLLCPVCLLLM